MCCKDSDDSWSELDEEEPNSCIEKYKIDETMLYPDNLDFQSKILSVAPAEGNVPVSPFNDFIEELAFPSIFCGEKRVPNSQRIHPLKFSEICKSELRRADRRATQNIGNIFFKTKKLQMKQIQDKFGYLQKKTNKRKQNYC